METGPREIDPKETERLAQGPLSLLATLEGHKDRVWNLAWSPNGDLLASCSGDKSIRLWSKIGDKWLLRDILDDGHERTVRRIAFSPNGQFLASASFDATCCIWELQDGEFKLIATLEGHENEVKCVDWAASGSLLATCSRDKSIWIWEMESDKEFECVSVLHGHTQDVKAIAWHPDREVLVSCSYDDTIKVWLDDDDDWFCSETLKGHTSTIWDMAFNASGTLLASCSDDRSLIIWKYTPPPQGKREGTDGTSCWKLQQKIDEAHGRTMYSVAWSKSNYLATSGADDSIKIYQQSESSQFVLKETKTKAHHTDVNCLRWNPKQINILASCGDDGLIRIWEYKP
jgi:WD40 repeat protein